MAVREQFIDIDKDGSGLIDEEEFHTIMSKTLSPPSLCFFATGCALVLCRNSAFRHAPRFSDFFIGWW